MGKSQAAKQRIYIKILLNNISCWFYYKEWNWIECAKLLKDFKFNFVFGMNYKLFQIKTLFEINLQSITLSTCFRIFYIMYESVCLRTIWKLPPNKKLHQNWISIKKTLAAMQFIGCQKVYTYSIPLLEDGGRITCVMILFFVLQILLETWDCFRKTTRKRKVYHEQLWWCKAHYFVLFTFSVD